MDKTNRTEIHRTFLIEALPEPLTRASAHLQVFDNYLPDTRLRIRSVRDPQTAAWTRILQQRFPERPESYGAIKFAEIYLNDAEYERFTIFEGEEIRKNRYFHEYDARSFAFDVYLGKLWGLNMARVEFESVDEMEAFETPQFAVIEVTNDGFFQGESLVHKTFEDVRAHVAGSASLPPLAATADE